MAARKTSKSRAKRSFFDGRYLIEITTWDWNLFLGVSPSAPSSTDIPELIDARAVWIGGEILAPEVDRGKSIRIILSPIDPDLVVSHADAEIGRLRTVRGQGEPYDFECQVRVPKDTLGPIVQCLDSVWKYAHLWSEERSSPPPAMTAISFSRDLPTIVREWASAPKVD